jgi:hypothetical protein
MTASVTTSASLSAGAWVAVSVVPPYRQHVRSILVPSGEKLGWLAWPPSLVSRQARPPSAGASQTSSSARR